MPLIKLIATGGTIANTSNGLVGIDDVLNQIPTLRSLSRFEVTEVVRIRSGSLQMQHWLELAQAVKKAAESPDIDGIVVTHGTFTVEESAYFLHLTIPTEKPIVLVASQRKHGDIGNDGDRNLVDAVRIALSSEARGKGVLVTLNEEIHSAREVVKTNQRPGGFVSPECGILGHVETDQVTFYYLPARRHTFSSEFDIEEIHALPRVDIVASYVGADDTAARACIGAGAKGLVVNGYAFTGRPSADQLTGLEAIADSGIPVVLVNRGGRGRVPIDWQDPFIQGDSLVAQKARILLMLALTKTNRPRDLQRFFNEY